ncbi:jg8768 [Pararge aegeria aegeria]|uniref:Jg8768 protein n=1 Tax=Pararge aegeria aegeria TaxID=348720 RepID=A0A8S4RXM1_9NEOP|nr:jg8768 [Pararge aegeria aegeria]
MRKRILDCEQFLYSRYSSLFHSYPTLRVYQKPEYLPLDSFLELSEEAKKNYIILEPKTYTREVYKQWLNSVAVLKKYESDFQIIIEAISTTDFAALNIKSVAILQGSECTVA